METAQRIRYQAYSAAGWIDPNPEERFADPYDQLPNSQTHLLSYCGQNVGTMRASVFTGEEGWNMVPSMRVFGDRIFNHTGNERFVELNRFALLPTFTLMPRQAQLALLNNAVHAADLFSCRYMVAAVRESHVPYYQRLEFVQVELARRYLGLKFDTVLMVMDWLDAKPRLLVHHLFHIIVKFPREIQRDAT